MTTVVFFALALFLGYVATVGLSLAASFAISSASREFVIKDHRIRRRFKFLEDASWLLCSIAGGYVTTMARPTQPLFAVVVLAVILIIVSWQNLREMRQRGIEHQIVMTFLCLAGVVIGYALRTK